MHDERPDHGRPDAGIGSDGTGGTDATSATDADDRSRVTRRSVLTTAGAAGLAGVGAAPASALGPIDADPRCPDATIRPDMIHHEATDVAACADDHPATERLRGKIDEAFRERYPTVGSLIEAGYVPYFDFLNAEETGGWSHWLNPEFIGDDAVLDPERPESILVDHRWWRPIGVMFVATTSDGEVDPPPAVYGEDGDDPCLPWHAHVGLPGRYAWWKFQLVDGTADGVVPSFPCRTPWMMHVWTYPHPEGVYVHGAPPRGNRGGPPAEDPGFETDAVPGEDDLGVDVLPDALRHRVRQRTEIARRLREDLDLGLLGSFLP